MPTASPTPAPTPSPTPSPTPDARRLRLSALGPTSRSGARYSWLVDGVPLSLAVPASGWTTIGSSVPSTMSTGHRRRPTGPSSGSWFILWDVDNVNAVPCTTTALAHRRRDHRRPISRPPWPRSPRPRSSPARPTSPWAGVPRSTSCSGSRKRSGAHPRSSTSGSRPMGQDAPVTPDRAGAMPARLARPSPSGSWTRPPVASSSRPRPTRATSPEVSGEIQQIVDSITFD